MNGSRRLPWDWYHGAVPENVVIGARSWIHSSFAFLHHRSEQPEAIVLGDDSGLYWGTDFLTGPLAQIRIGKFCTIVGAAFATNGTISIADYAFVAHDVTFSDGPVAVPPEVSPADRGPTTEIAENVWIATRVTILGGSRIGQGSVIGAGSVVDGEIPAYVMAAGIPARVVAPVPGAP